MPEQGHGEELLGSIYRVMATLRWALLVQALLVNLYRWRQASHPLALLVLVAVMVLWTPVVNRLQGRAATRTQRLMAADLVLCCLLILPSRWVLGDEILQPGQLMVPAYWIYMAPLVTAVWRGRWFGVGAALLVDLTRFVANPTSDASVWAAMVGMVLTAWCLGAIVETLKASVDQREAENARAATLAERDRLNRIVHDGALQVLAMVEREGPELGPRGVQLAEMARAQELILRRQLQDRDVVLPSGSGRREQADEALPTTDLTAMLEAHQDARITVSVTAEAVAMASGRARELDAALTEALVNFERHAGHQARAWVLLEAEEQEVVVTVRDNGIGMSREQVHTASTTGRMGIHDSILGRIQDIGGTAVARSRPGRGVEWEFRVPMDQE